MVRPIFNIQTSLSSLSQELQGVNEKSEALELLAIAYKVIGIFGLINTLWMIKNLKLTFRYNVQLGATFVSAHDMIVAGKNIIDLSRESIVKKFFSSFRTSIISKIASFKSPDDIRSSREYKELTKVVNSVKKNTYSEAALSCLF